MGRYEDEVREGRALDTRAERVKKTVRRFPRKPVWRTLMFRMRVRSTEFEVLADALAGELQTSALTTHGCRDAEQPIVRVNGKLVDFRRRVRK